MTHGCSRFSSWLPRVLECSCSLIDGGRCLFVHLECEDLGRALRFMGEQLETLSVRYDFADALGTIEVANLCSSLSAGWRKLQLRCSLPHSVDECIPSRSMVGEYAASPEPPPLPGTSLPRVQAPFSLSGPYSRFIFFLGKANCRWQDVFII